MTTVIIRGDAARLPLPSGSVDLVVTSPPYWGQRAYADGGEVYDGQIGSEETPAEYVAALLACTREWMRVLKPEGSLFANLGDKYAGKSLLGLPQRYVIGCMDDLGLILRAEVIWAKPNGLPESVTDRVRRSHEQVFHLTRSPRYYSAVDEIREPHAPQSIARSGRRYLAGDSFSPDSPNTLNPEQFCNPLGKLPGSVWSIPSAPLKVPAELGIDHFAAYPPELVRRIVLGWSPTGICTECGEGRRPVTQVEHIKHYAGGSKGARNGVRRPEDAEPRTNPVYAITGYACACPQPDAPPRPAVVLDPFGGTGTTALVADMHGRTGITVDRSADYCRLAAWRTSDPGERARVLRLPKPRPEVARQASLFSDLEAAIA